MSGIEEQRPRWALLETRGSGTARVLMILDEESEAQSIGAELARGGMAVAIELMPPASEDEAPEG